MRRLTATIAALALIALACGGDDVSDTVAPTTAAPATAAPTTEAPTTEAPAGAAVQLASSGLGDILVDGAGNSLYLFVPDGQGASTCYDGCAEAWPPLTEAAEAGNGVDASLLGSTARDDGTTQLTYNGWPLYYFAADAAPGETNGQGVNDVWFVLGADGNAIP